MKKLYDFYCSVEAIHHEIEQCRPVMRLVDGKTYNECVETGKKPTSKWGDLVLVAQAVDMTHVAINGVKQEGGGTGHEPDMQKELESVKKDNKTLRRQIAEILQKG